MINILFCGNDAVSDGLTMSVLSIAKHTKEPLNIIIFTMDLSKIKKSYTPIKIETIKRLQNYLKNINYKSQIQLIDVSKSFNENFSNSVNIKNLYSPYAFIRLLADKIEQIPDKVLYLDTDVLANNDISQLYNIDLKDFECAGVKDYLGSLFINKKYMNSGVMLLNMTKIRETKLFEKCRNIINKKKMLFPDQSALNKFARKKKFLDSKFNSQKDCNEEDVLRHFRKKVKWLPFPHTINVKPYEIEKMHKVLKCFHYDDIYNLMIDLKENNNDKIK